MRPSLALALLLALAASAFAGDAPDPKAVARDYLHGDAAARAAAERIVAGADADLLRRIVAAMREASRPAAPAEAEEPAAPIAKDAPLVTFEVEKAAAERLGIRADLAPHVLDAAALAAIEAAVQGKEGVSTTAAPRVTVYDQQRANLSVVNHFSYVQDYDIESSNGGLIADPVIGVVEDGVLLALKPAVAADRKTVLTNVDFTLSDLVRPMAEFKTKVAGTDQEVTIQLPEVRVLKRSHRVPAPPGATVLLDAFPRGSEDRLCVALLRAVLAAGASEPEVDVRPTPK